MRVEFVDASGDRSHVKTDVDTAALLGQIKRRGATCGIELAVKRREAEVAEREARERMVRIECVVIGGKRCEWRAGQGGGDEQLLHCTLRRKFETSAVSERRQGQDATFTQHQWRHTSPTDRKSAE